MNSKTGKASVSGCIRGIVHGLHRGLLGILIPVWAMSVAGCENKSDPANWNILRYRLTAVVVVDGDEKQGSSVIEVWQWKHGGSPAVSTGPRIIGTAPIVNLSNYGWLIVPLTPEYIVSYSWPSPSRTNPNWPLPLPGLPPPRRTVPTAADFPVKAAGSTQKWLDAPKRFDFVELADSGNHNSPAGFPQLVWVPPEITDRTPVLPLLRSEMPKWIGGGARLKALIIEPTTDPVKTRVDPAPAWLQAMREPDYIPPGPYGLGPSKLELSETAPTNRW